MIQINKFKLASKMSIKARYTLFSDSEVERGVGLKRNDTGGCLLVPTSYSIVASREEVKSKKYILKMIINIFNIGHKLYIYIYIYIIHLFFFKLHPKPLTIVHLKSEPND